MTWLQPWAWLGVGALVVPVVVHLFSRRPARTESFPSLRFLAATELRPTRRTRLSDWPLLLVRMAIVLAAVMALAQPTRRAALAPEPGAVSRIRVVDTLTVGAASVPRDSVETIATAFLPEGLERAGARLHAMPAPRALEVVSTFVIGAADSTLFAALPADLTLVLTSAAPRPSAPVASRNALAWQTVLPASATEAVARAALQLGGPSVVIAPRAAADPVPRQTITRERIRFAGDSGEFLAEQANAMRRVAQDPVVQALLMPPLALQLQRTTDHLQLAVNSDRADLALALLLASGGAAPEQPVGHAPDAATLARWAHAPAGRAMGAGLVTTDVHRIATDARWGWLLVLVLLVVEWRMRRAPRREPAGRA